jgi:hypothetical protein
LYFLFLFFSPVPLMLFDSIFSTEAVFLSPKKLHYLAFRVCFESL